MTASDTHPKTGVLLINLGTPTAPKSGAIRRWLKEFLLDERVIEIPRLIWLPILYLFILPLRPMKLAQKYKGIWTEQGSPLLAISEQQKAGLQAALDDNDHCCVVALGMRYGEPNIRTALLELSQAGVDTLIILPLYPQYSATTTASSIEAVVDQMREFRNLPALRTLKDYHDHPSYIAALAESVKKFREQHGAGDHLLISFHGLPQRNADLGDPYPEQCEVTARLLAEELELADTDWTLTYQSRFGKAQWLEPATDTTLQELAKHTAVIDVLCPGFAADCLETLEEINVENRMLYKQAGGADLRYIPALNDAPDHIALLATLVADNLPPKN